MIYAKIQSENEALFFEGRVLRDGGDVIANPTGETLRSRGYFPLREVERPTQKPGYSSLPCYREENGEVLLTYRRIHEGEVSA